MDYNSWSTMGESIAVKQCDKTFFNHHGSGIPKDMRWYWNADRLEAKARMDIILTFETLDYQAYIARGGDGHGRTRIFWYSDLDKKFNDYRSQVEEGATLYLRFVKIGVNHYDIGFIFDELVKEDSDYHLHTEVELPDATGAKEGKKLAFYTTKYERNPKNRRDAIFFHGLKCHACGFDFEETYGPRGKNYIEVHHTKPLYDLKKEVTVDPKTDLVCVCSNCHCMIHRKQNEILGVEELKEIINRKK